MNVDVRAIVWADWSLKHFVCCWSARQDRLIGLVVTASASRAGDLGFESRLRLDFAGRVIPVI